MSSFKDGIDSGELSIYEDIDKKLKLQFKKPPKLYYIAVGRDDFVKKINDDYRLKLSDAGYKYTYRETDGGHSWENWRKYLVDFLPRLFNYKRNKMKQQIRTMLEEALPLVDFDSDFLFSELDSLGVTTILMMLSDKFAIKLEASDATPRNLKTLDSIVALVEGKIKEKGNVQ